MASARGDGGISRTVSSGQAEHPGTTISPGDDARTPRTPRTPRGPVSPQQQAADRAANRAADRAADPLPAHAERVAAERQFRQRIERELTVELRSALHLSVSGTVATLDCRGRSFTLTYGGFVERTRRTASGGFMAYTVRAWWITPAERGQQAGQNIAEGELQAGLLAYPGIQRGP